MGRRRTLPPEPATGRVEARDERGHGVLRVGEARVAVPATLGGELVSFRYRRRRRGGYEGELLEVLEASPARVPAPCPHYAACGGCTRQHEAPPAQLADKEATLLRALVAALGEGPERLLAPVTAAPWHYRRRARLGVRHVPKKGGALVGFREKQGGLVAEMGSCAVLAEPAGSLIAGLRRLVSGLAAAPALPQIEVAVGDGAAALVFRHLEPLGEADRTALAGFARATGVHVYLQAGGLETVEPLAPAPPPALHYRLDEFDLTLRFRPTDFVQVNGPVNARLVHRVVELLAPAPGERIADLFCGIGNFTLPLARQGAAVLGVEGDAGLVARARDNAALNRLGAVRFAAADLCTEPAAAGETWLSPPPDKVLLDPPRTGAEAVVAGLRAPYPRRIVYVSCHPGTFARDAAVLVRRHGYRLRAAGVVDMFPHTEHVEVLALLTRAAR